MAERLVNQGCWPDIQQELLLQSCLWDGEQAISAWHEWKARVDVATLDSASQKLLPLLYHNLTRQGVQDPVLRLFKGHYRVTWYKNQMLFNAAKPVVLALAGVGIEALVLKGPALATLYYKDLGLRAMLDFDILVPSSQAQQAIDVLHRSGWKPKGGYHLRPEYIKVRNGCGFEDGSGRQIDLHWHLLPECCYEAADADFWASAVGMPMDTHTVLALNPTDFLWHVCLHGYKWDPIPPFRWIADATMILRRAGGSIDWRRFLRLTRERRLVLPIRHTLGYLSHTMLLPIPDQALVELASLPISAMERREYQAHSQPLSLRGLAAIHWARHARIQAPASRSRQLWTFPRYLQYGLGLEHAWQAPLLAVSEGRRRVRIRSSSQPTVQ